ncbi:TP53-regulated inhibitor of apoptosis 1-like [Saccoglossus kowalevskii]|uniref:TP53-regulated inhibitor of apoptosis 1-like n=1 Tax=Saccoglossus kowalevskii TaxID=10224 RepID=A0ABM0GP23_SACKO|nr:PREDICTED: TP53-regulated inhibitor of apoptosis 1-like [Saccoglossus kowalevskii]
MNSVGEDCNDLKREYDACFNKWFTERYLKGDYYRDPCKKIFKKYQTCVKTAMKNKHLDLEEMDKDILGTEFEKKPLPKKKKETDKTES